MTNFATDFGHYHPGDYRFDVPGVLSGFVILATVLAILLAI